MATSEQRAEPRDAAAFVTALAQRAAAGDTQAFRAWTETTHGTVYRLALRMVGVAADAEDVVQESYMRAWQTLPKLRQPQASLAFVCGIARHVAKDRLRLRARSQRTAEALTSAALSGVDPLGRLSATDISAEEIILKAQTQAQVRLALGSLREKHRLVLLLRDADELTYEEIAAALGIPVGTVESRLHRARAALAAKLVKLRKRAELWEEGRSRS